MERNIPAKLRNIKYIPEKLFKVDDILRSELESKNKSCFVLTTSGQLYIFSWIKKKTVYKTISDISDALWQYDGESELVASCHSGAFLRYTLQHDTGLTCSLQLSAPTFLSLLKAKDPSIISVKSMKLWGHSKDFILAQPQSDKLVILSTNSGDRPSVLEIIRTMPMRTAHLVNLQIIVQPITGSDIYIHDAHSGKTTEVLVLSPAREEVTYFEWGSLSCSLSTSKFALTDSERRIYLGDITEKSFLSKKSGIVKSSITPRQLVWPATIKPLTLLHLTITFSKDAMSIFCSGTKNEREVFYYLTCDVNDQGTLTLVHEFEKETFLIPGLLHDLPDLFLTDAGIAMLFEQDVTEKPRLECDLTDFLQSMREALQNQEMNQVAQLKATLEQDLCIFLSSCNHVENWLEMARHRSEQHAELVDMILSHLTKLSTDPENKALALSLKELAKHHFKTMQEEVHNVLNYVDAEKVSQMLLQMSEQMKFYSVSVEALILPESDRHQQDLLDKFEEWGDKSAREILRRALEENSVTMAESYLKLKPWIYGEMDRRSIVSLCIDIAKENPSAKLIQRLDSSYTDILKEKLFCSKELSEIQLLDGLLREWGALSPKEELSLLLLKHIYTCCPYLTTKPPSFWQDLISYGETVKEAEETDAVQSAIEELTVEKACKLSDLSLMLLLSDLYARTGDIELLSPVSAEALWEYLLLKKDREALQKWIYCYLDFKTDGGESHTSEASPFDASPGTVDADGALPEETITSIESVELASVSSTKESPDCSSGSEEAKLSRSPPSASGSPPSGEKAPPKRTRKTSRGNQSLLGHPIYGSDTDSLYSLDSSCTADQSANPNPELPYIASDWPDRFFKSLSQPMIDQLTPIEEGFGEELLDSLSQFGIFATEEKGDEAKMIRRWLAVPDFDLRMKECHFEGRVAQESFDKSILSQFGELELFSPFYEYFQRSNLKWADLPLDKFDPSKRIWTKLVKLFEDLTDESAFVTGVESLRYAISNCEGESDIPEEVLFDAFLTMLVAPNATLKDFVSFQVKEEQGREPERDTEGAKKEEVLSLANAFSQVTLTPRLVVERLVQHHPYLDVLVGDQASLMELDVTAYDLLNGNVPFDVASLFTFQKSNKYGHTKDSKIPSLTHEGNSQEGSPHETTEAACSLDFCYYLKSGRPTFAFCSLLKKCLETDKQDCKGMEGLEGPVYGLALSSWPNRRVSSACIALLYMTERNCSLLRDLVHTADLVVESWSHEFNSSVSEDLCKSQLSLVTQEIQSLLIGICSSATRDDSASKLVKYLEESVIARVNGHPLLIASKLEPEREWATEGNLSEEGIHQAFRGLQLGNAITSAYGLTPPLRILDFLAQSGHWLMFLTACELFSYPHNLVLQLSRRFPSLAMREHMNFALNNASKYKRAPAGSSKEPKQSPKGVRQSLYSRIGIDAKGGDSVAESTGSSPDSFSGTPPSVVEKGGGVESKTSEESFVIESDLVSCSSVSSALSWIPPSETVDVLGVFLQCYKKSNSVERLLEASLKLKAPVFAVFAACLSQTDRVPCLAIWLYSFLTKKCTTQFFSFVKDLNCNLTEETVSVGHFLAEEDGKEVLKVLILYHLNFGHLDIVRDGLTVFYKENYLTPILGGLESTLHGKSVVAITQKLNGLLSISEQGNCVLSTKDTWLQNLCLDVLTVGVDVYLKNNWHKKRFLEAVLPVQSTYPFSLPGLSWNSIYKIQEIVVVSDASSFNIKMMISMYKEDTVKETGFEMIQSLIVARKFKVALKLASHLSLDSSEVICEEIKHRHQLERNSISKSLNSMTEFLKRVQRKATSSKIPPFKVYKLFESISEACPTTSLSYLSLAFASMWLSDHLSSAEEGESKAEEGESKAEEGESKAEEGESKAEEGESKAEEGESKAKEGESKAKTSPKELNLMHHLESKLWTAYVNSRATGDKFADRLSLLPPDLFGSWPWEAKTIAESFDYDQIARNITDFPNEDYSYGAAMSDAFTKEANYLINECLNLGLLRTAIRVTKLFSIANKNVENLLSILKTATQLQFLPSEEDSTDEPSQSNATNRKRNKGISFNSSFNLFPIKLEPGEIKDKNMAQIYQLTSDMTHGKLISKKILMLCRVAEALRCPFLDLLQRKDSTKLLKDVLSLKRSDSTQVARELIEALSVPFADVNRLFVEEVVATITAGPGDSGDEYHGSFLSWNDLEERWQELLTLTDDPTPIGQQLLQIAQDFGSSHPDQVQRVHSISVELVIRAHDCYSCAASMEGLSTVLRKCLTLVRSLVKNRLWQLMVRLLTGIRRYKAMSYVFDILRENHQFEHLLGRISVPKMKKSGLDQALVHYLKSKHPEDKETLRMVALHFLLYSEVAKMYEDEAIAAIKKVVSDSLSKRPEEEAVKRFRNSEYATFWWGPESPGDSSDNLHKSIDYLRNADSDLLEKAMDSYAHAARYSLQEKMMAKAVYLTRQAQLVSIQLCFVSGLGSVSHALRIVNLSPTMANFIVSQYVNVQIAVVISNAYDISIDWSSAIYHNFIKRGDNRFLHDYLHFLRLSSDIVLDITKKIEANQVPEHVNRMSKLLVHVKDVALVYEVASRLSLRDVIEQCLKSPALPYLQDTIFLHGFNSKK